MQENSSLDPVALDPDKFEVRLENDRVRVLEACIHRSRRGPRCALASTPPDLHTFSLQGARYIHRWKQEDNGARRWRAPVG